MARDDETRRTVGASFEFAGLVDGAPPPTKGELAAALMEFLTAPGAQDVSGGGPVPRSLALGPPHPSPVIGRSTLRYVLPRAGHLHLDLIDPAGRRVAKLVDQRQAAGSHELTLDGRRLAGGTYLLSGWFDGEILTGKCTILR